MEQSKRKKMITHRAQAIAHYMIYNEATMKSTAKVFAVSEDTVLQDINKRLKGIDSDLYIQVRKIIDTNKNRSLNNARNAKKVVNK